MLTRQKIILNLIARAGGEVSRLQLMKWAFLLAKEYRSKHTATFYQFLPYRFGPFSFTLYHELDVAIRHRYLLARSERKLTLSAGIDQSFLHISPALGGDIDLLWRKYGRLSTSVLVDNVYNRYPWFTLNSDNCGRRMVSRPVVPPAVYTAGYEGMHVDGFLNMLLETGIRGVIDVRKNPISRRYGFHKSTLAKLCKRVEIRYEHLPELGIPSRWRRDVHEWSDYELLFERYENEVLASSRQTVASIANRMRVAPCVLVCQEADPDRCHRSRLGVAVSQVSGLSVCNMGDGKWGNPIKERACSSQ